MRKPKENLKTATNRSVYNKARKEFYAGCSFCKWHGNHYRFSENSMNKSFFVDDISRPNWKLVSKQKKQWMKKPLKQFKPRYWGDVYSHTQIYW